MTRVLGRMLFFDPKQVIASRLGLITQLRSPAYAYDDAARERKLTKPGSAKAGDLFWLGEPAVYYTAGNSKSDLVFPADGDRGMASAPKWIAGRHNLKRHTVRPQKLARAYSKRCLEVTGARHERLAMITSGDAEACGAELHMRAGRPHYRMRHDWHAEGQTPGEAYLAWWKRVYGKDSVAASVIVAVLEFRLIDENADQYAARLAADAGALTVANEALGARAA